MNINKNLCEKLYTEVKTKLQEEFVRRGMTYRGSETSIWKLVHPKTDKTYFQIILEESTKTQFTTTFNHMYLWRKRNEVQGREVVNFQEDYLILFTKFLGYTNPQEYINAFSLTLSSFFGIKKEGKIVVVQPIFDANKDVPPPDLGGKFPLANEQTVDSRDTECLLELINLFHDYNQTLPKRVYDQELVTVIEEKLSFSETILNLNKTTCIFSIGFYSNYFFRWVLTHHVGSYLEYLENPVRFRVRYWHPVLQEAVWTDYYENSPLFDCGFLLKYPIRLATETIPCYFFCGIENKGTRAITSYLCQHWKTIQQKHDSERDEPLNDAPYVMVFKVNKSNLVEIYTEKVVKLDF
ncbi:MAG: hypothetical protein U0Y10_07275 [Spirosomataceae bacterium]